jgi:uncharacterized protein
MRLSWDEEKNKINKAKHGVSFEVAQHVFSDPLHRSLQDRHVGGEERWQTVGKVAGVLLLLVSHTWDIDEEEEIRIISARKATAHERNSYEEQGIY